MVGHLVFPGQLPCLQTRKESIFSALYIPSTPVYLHGEQDSTHVVVDAGDVILRGRVQEQDVSDAQEWDQHQQSFSGLAVLLSLRIVG